MLHSAMRVHSNKLTLHVFFNNVRKLSNSGGKEATKDNTSPVTGWGNSNLCACKNIRFNPNLCNLLLRA